MATAGKEGFGDPKTVIGEARSSPGTEDRSGKKNRERSGRGRGLEYSPLSRVSGKVLGTQPRAKTVMISNNTLTMRERMPSRVRRCFEVRTPKTNAITGTIWGMISF
jgi:hypothetical protein